MYNQHPNQLQPINKIHHPHQPHTIKLIKKKHLNLFIINTLQQIFQTPQKQIHHSQLFNIIFKKQIQHNNNTKH